MKRGAQFSAALMFVGSIFALNSAFTKENKKKDSAFIAGVGALLCSFGLLFYPSRVKNFILPE
jgi:multisubunit Na+/H+ antiporter MnhB subunit